ncbi:transcriptional regulator [Enemella evansiae]|nr:transcriptional regulator [Enemella evansiae]
MTGRTVTDVPSESPDVIELIRRAALASRENLPEVRDSVDQKTLSALGMTDIAADPELSAAMARANHSNLTRWIDANIAYPGEPVPANTSRELLDHFRNAVRRGLDSTGMDAFRTGQNAAWRWWMAAVFAQAEDLEQARAALEITSASISDFVDRTMRAVWDRIQAERDDLLHSSQAEKRELVELILAGQAASPARATRILGHRLDGAHTALVIWTADPDPDSGLLADTARRIASAWGATRTLTVVPSAGSLWVWVDAEAGSYPAAQLPHGLQVAVGSHGRGLAGFRRSHLDAVTVQQLLARLDSPTRIATIEQVALVNLVTKDPIAAAEFTRRTLGQLAAADQGLREVLRVHLHGGCRTTHTAQALHLHRNTVVRQLAKAERLLPAPLEDGGVAVAVALDILHWQR